MFISAKRTATEAFEGPAKSSRQYWMGPQRWVKRKATEEVGGPGKARRKTPVSDYVRKQIMLGRVDLNTAFQFAISWAEDEVYSPERFTLLTNDELDETRANIEAVVDTILKSITMTFQCLVFK